MFAYSHVNPKTNPPHNGHDPGIAEDRLVVDRCVAGEAGAWDELYRRHHGGLSTSIKSMFGTRCGDPEVIDEIAARVWYRIVTNRAALLDRFDAGMGGRLRTYLVAIAKRETADFLRSEKRRRRRERAACRPEMQAGEAGEPWPTAEWPRFIESLTPRERRFLVECLLRPGDTSPPRISAANRWQLSCRIRSKLQRFLDC